MRLSPRLSMIFVTAAAAVSGLAPVAAAIGDDLDEEAVRREIGQKYGECVASGRLLKPHAIRFVLSGLPSDAVRLSHGNCLRKAAAGHASSYRTVTGAWATGIYRKIMADGLVRTDFATSGPTDFSAVPALDPTFSMAALESSRMPQDVRLTLAVDHVAECAARKQPEAVRQLAQTDINSPEELVALRGLAPTFGECLPQAVAVNFPRYLLRDAAVLAYARMAYSLTAAGSTQETAG